MKVLGYSVFPRRWLLSCRGEWEESFIYSLSLSRKQLQDCPALEWAIPLLSWHLLRASAEVWKRRCWRWYSCSLTQDGAVLTPVAQLVCRLGLLGMMPLSVCTETHLPGSLVLLCLLLPLSEPQPKRYFGLRSLQKDEMWSFTSIVLISTIEDVSKLVKKAICALMLVEAHVLSLDCTH